ncbi:UNVERIFIED_CONTAM: putative mitochondrial protein [Sesamum radiatum]|uniref:Mitochondrial protein n=1 Tax=Sesamum radiatum TaxID=300843 RepID=A0AAW2V533_SESRA
MTTDLSKNATDQTPSQGMKLADATDQTPSQGMNPTDTPASEQELVPPLRRNLGTMAKQFSKNNGGLLCMLKISALEKNNTWCVTELPPNKKAIGCRWVYKLKLNSYGSVDRCKERLVAKGYNQIEGIDYTDFAHLPKLSQ